MAQLVAQLKQRFFDSNGNPLVGGKLFSYQAGTSTPLATYTDQSGSAPNSNPVILDANAQADVWIGTSAYKFVLKDASDVVQWTIDNVSTIEPQSITTAKLADGSVTTVKIVDQNVTTAKIADNAISSAKIAQNAVLLTHVANKMEWVQTSTNELLPRYDWSTPQAVYPITQPPGTGRSVSFSPDGRYLAVAHLSSPGLSLYERRGGTFIKRENPSTLIPGYATGCAWSPSGEFLCAVSGISSTPAIIVYEMIQSGALDFTQITGSTGAATVGNALTTITSFSDAAANIGSLQVVINNLISLLTNKSLLSKLPNPATPPTNQLGKPAWSPDSRFLAIAQGSASPYVSIYQRAGKTLTRLSDPTDQPLSAANCCDFSPDGTYLALSYAFVSPYFIVYSRTGTGFTKLSDPATAPPDSANCLAFSPDSSLLAIAHQTTPYVSVYTVAGSTLTKISNPATLPAGNANAVSFSPNGKYLAVGHLTTPYLTIYSISGTTLTALTAPSTLPASDVNGLAWSPDGQFLACAHAGAPYLTIYQTSSTLGSGDFVYLNGVSNV